MSHGLLDELDSMLTTQITADVCDGDIDRRRISSIELPAVAASYRRLLKVAAKCGRLFARYRRQRKQSGRDIT